MLLQLPEYGMKIWPDGDNIRNTIVIEDKENQLNNETQLIIWRIQ